ncbi:MAG TPA: hypothetical protein VFR85_02365 [Anaeromyxobacteraceae bacterium]|nr:hypothetical protein [Anaeromyxobacteraceae bacterium]
MNALAAALALLAAAQAAERAPAGAQPRDSAAPPAGDSPHGWSERRSTEAGFAAQMPCEPGPMGAPVDLPSERGPLRMVVWGCEVARGEGYGVVVMELPPAAAAELGADALDQMAEQMAKRSAARGAHLARSLRRTIAGAPARDLTFESEGKAQRVLVVLDGRRLLQAVASRGSGETIPGSEPFYDSFRPLR